GSLNVAHQRATSAGAELVMLAFCVVGAVVGGSHFAGIVRWGGRKSGPTLQPAINAIEVSASTRAIVMLRYSEASARIVLTAKSAKDAKIAKRIQFGLFLAFLACLAVNVLVSSK